MIYVFVLYLENTVFYRDQYHTNTKLLIEVVYAIHSGRA